MSMVYKFPNYITDYVPMNKYALSCGNRHYHHPNKHFNLNKLALSCFVKSIGKASEHNVSPTDLEHMFFRANDV